MRKMSSRILLTGATGQIGSELTLELRKRYGRDNVIAAGHKRKPSKKLLNSGPFEHVEVTRRETIENVVNKYDIGTIYHLAAILSVKGEKNPQLAWNVNMIGLHNVLEIAREYGVTQVFWPSSIAVFGPETPRVKTPQETILIPRTIYGAAKVAGELICNYYFNRFGLDVRSVRYPGVISSETLPGGGVTDYAVAMFYGAIRKKRYTCFVRAETILPMMYMPDCIEAATKLMEADPSKIKHHVGYNVAAMSFSAEELVMEIKKYISEFKCEYKLDFRQKIADSWPMSVDDCVAREEWGWKSTYDLAAMTKDLIENLKNRFADGNVQQ
jgi:nucleoside-diphosphate-sugar epimerase